MFALVLHDFLISNRREIHDRSRAIRGRFQPRPNVATIRSATTPLICKATDSTAACAAEIPEAISTTINLAMQVVFLSKYASLGNISSSSITCRVSNNSLNVALPPLSIHLAPMAVTDPTDPRAELFGTTQAMPAATDSITTVQLVSNAPAIFQMFTENLSTPFNFVATRPVEIVAGTPVPMGPVTISITRTICAQP
jgi:hypothetical protein